MSHDTGLELIIDEEEFIRHGVTIDTISSLKLAIRALGYLNEHRQPGRVTLGDHCKIEGDAVVVTLKLPAVYTFKASGRTVEFNKKSVTIDDASVNGLFEFFKSNGR